MLVDIQSSKDRVMIAVDPHKASWTAAAVDASLQPLANIMDGQNEKRPCLTLSLIHI